MSISSSGHQGIVVARQVTFPKVPGWVGLVHGDLNAANIMVDIHANAWYIDFAVRALITKCSCIHQFLLACLPRRSQDVKFSLPLTDVAKLINTMLLEYTSVIELSDSPISPGQR